MEVPFQFIKEVWLQVFVVTISIDSSKSIKHLNYSLQLNCTAVLLNWEMLSLHDNLEAGYGSKEGQSTGYTTWSFLVY